MNPGEGDVAVGFTFAIVQAVTRIDLISRRVRIGVDGDLVVIPSQRGHQSKLIGGTGVEYEGRESSVAVDCVVNHLPDRGLQTVVAAICVETPVVCEAV